MASLEEIRKARLAKLQTLRKAGVLAYPGKVKRTHTARQATEEFSKLSKAGKEVVLAGRVWSLRGHGGSAFFHLADGTGKFQGYVKKDAVGEKTYQAFLASVDVGDIVQARGTLFATRKGEKTLLASDVKMLAKALLPLPDKWHGLQDVEERYRKRYLDLLFNEEVKEKFKTKAAILRALRVFLHTEGFVEVETPILQPLYGGAEAKPFTTHLDAFDIKMYLRIAPELYLKRLVVGGFEKVYEIGRVFRNEGVDRMHNPDFTMLEFYWAYADYKDMMRMTERLLASVSKEVLGKTSFLYEGKKIDLKGPFPRVEYAELLRKHAKVDVFGENRESLAKKAKKLGVEFAKNASKYQIADDIYKRVVRPKMWEPTFVIHHPAGSIPLAKPLDEDPTKLGTFQLVLAGGWELVKAYTELNNPLAQKEVFQEQEKHYKEGMEDAQRMDEDYVEALEYGMPPTAGFGMGIDRLTALLTNSHSLREVILFPTMKPKLSS